MRHALAILIASSFIGACSADPDTATGALPGSCQALADGLWMCASRLPLAAREPLVETLEAHKKAWLGQAKSGRDDVATLERGCRDALEHIRGATRELCVGITWGSTPAAATTTAPALPARAPDVQPTD